MNTLTCSSNAETIWWVTAGGETTMVKTAGTGMASSQHQTWQPNQSQTLPQSRIFPKSPP